MSSSTNGYAYEGNLNLSPTQKEMLLCTEGQTRLSKILGKSYKKRIGDMSRVKGDSEEDCQMAVAKIESLFTSCSINLTQEENKFVRSRSKANRWAVELSRLENGSECLRIIYESGRVELECFVDRVDEAKAIIFPFLDAFLGRSVKESVQLKKGVYRLVQKCCVQRLLDIQKNFQVELRLHAIDQTWELHCEGSKAKVPRAMTEIDTLIRSVEYQPVTSSKPGLHDYFLDKNELGYKQVKALEAKYQCTVGVRKGTHDTDLRAPSALPAPRHSGSIKVVLQDITNCKELVIVCSISTTNTELKECGDLAKAFSETGSGDSLSQEFRNLGGLKKGEVKSTSAPGHSSWKRMVYGRLGRWKDSSPKYLETLLSKCLEEVKSQGASSVAFPALGCGGLQYPPEQVAKCFTKVMSTVTSIQVSIYTLDQGVHDTLKQHLGSGTRSAPSRRAIADVHQVVFHINTLVQSVMTSTVNDLQKIIDDSFRDTTISDQAVEDLDRKQEQKVKRCQSRHTEIEIDKSNSDIHIRGESRNVDDAARKIEAILESMKDVWFWRRHGKREEFLKAFADSPMRIPRRWSLAAGTTAQLCDVDAATRKVVSDLMMDTWNPTYVARGVDATGLSRTHLNIKVTGVHRIENRSSFRRYMANLKNVCAEALDEEFHPIEKLYAPETNILTTRKHHAALKTVPEVNEVFLFHGTKEATISHVCAQGFDTRMSRSGMFGRGMYLAESSTKADQYSDDQGARKFDADLQMVVVRVTLGHVHHQMSPKPYLRPPCRYDKCISEQCDHHFRYHSVMATHKSGGTRLNFREFIVYDNTLNYPEFVVTYQRVQ